MELDELLKKKEATQQAIAGLLNDFEKETGVHVSNVDFNQSRTTSHFIEGSRKLHPSFSIPATFSLTVML